MWWNGFFWLRVVACFCEHGIELLRSIKDGGFLDQLSNYELFKDCPPWS
jgi:hypothetical protein